MNIRSWYAGALTLMLAGTALLLRRTAERIGVAVFAVFVVSMVVGLPPVFDLVTKLPLFKAAHNERLLIYFALCLALLAGWGLDDLASRRLPSLRSRRAVIGAGAVLLCVPIVWMARAGTLTTDGLASALKVAWGFQHPPAVPPKVDVLAAPSAYIVRSSALLMWLPLAALGLALIVWRLRPGRRLPVAAFVGLAAALLVVDLFRANMGFNPAIRTSTAVQPATGAIRYLQSRRPNRFVGLGANVRQRMPPNVAMNYGLYDARGYDYPVEKHLDAFWRRIVAPTASDFTQPEEFSDATPTAIRALTLVSVSDLIGSTGDPPLHVPGLRVAYRGPDAIVYANDRALPRVLLVDQQRTVSRDRTALAAVTAPGFDARRIAVTERALPGLPQATPGAPRAGGTARMVSYGGERVIIDATAPRPSLLVLTDTFYPGWKATVDGRPAPIERVDYMLRGVALKPGRHTVEFSYRPASWRIGWIISLVSLVALIAAALWGWRVWYRGRSR
jgi:membrane protein YfhO